MAPEQDSRKPIRRRGGVFTPILCRHCKEKVWHLRKTSGQTLILAEPTFSCPLHNCFALGRGVAKPDRDACDDLFDAKRDT